MLTYLKNTSNNTIQPNLWSSSSKGKRQSPETKRIELLVIRLFSDIARIIQNIHSRLFFQKPRPKNKIKTFELLTPLSDFFKKNKSTIIKITLFSICISALVASRHELTLAREKLPKETGNVNTLDNNVFFSNAAAVESEISSKLFTGGLALLALVAEISLAVILGFHQERAQRKLIKVSQEKLISNVNQKFSKLTYGDKKDVGVGKDVIYEIQKFASDDPEFTNLFSILTGIPKEEFNEQVENTNEKKEKLASMALEIIEESEECKKLFKQILDNDSLSSTEKLDKITCQLRAEIDAFELGKVFSIKRYKTIWLRNHNPKFVSNTASDIVNYITSHQRKDSIAKAQLHFADKLIDCMRMNFQDPTIYNIKTIAKIEQLKETINNIKIADYTLPEKADRINQAITNWINENEAYIKNRVYILLFEKNTPKNDKIKAILPCIAEFNKLRQLDLSDQLITTLPDSLGNLERLKELNLSHNQIATLPDSLGNLEWLTELNLSHNQIATLPDSLGNLERLEELNLSHNQIAIIPGSFNRLTFLNTLDLSHNQVVTLPNDYRSLLLKTLDLSHNQITTLPDSLGNLEWLKELNLSHNQIATLDSIGNLRYLPTLNLSHNQIATLPDSIGNLKNLITLNLSHNQIATLPDSIGNLERLRTLNLSHNQNLYLSHDQIMSLQNLL